MRFQRKLLLTCIPIFLELPLFVLVLTLIPDRYASESPDKNRKVYVGRIGNRYTLYRNGRPFYVRGASGYTYLKELRAAGGNTIRTYDTLQLSAILDEAGRNNIAVIVGLPVPASAYLEDVYKKKEKVSEMYMAVRNTVRRYRDHPAVLMWCLGNEPGITWRPGNDAFYNAYNSMLNMIHDEDPDHPVTTTMPNYNIAQVLMIKYRIPGLDLISFNTFGKLKQIRAQLKRYASLWNGPFLIMEWGAYGPWESDLTAWNAPLESTSTKKAAHYREMYEKQMPLEHPGFLGSMVFFWGQKQEITPTWFSMFSESGAAMESVHVLKQLWRRTKPDNNVPRLKYMLVDGKGAADNLMFRPGNMQAAEVFMEKDNKAKITSIQWQIMKEDWYEDLRKKSIITRFLDTLTDANNGKRLLFTAPLKEGPYRIYVRVADDLGNIATANTPFYVIK
jgi:hypothetical protein